MQRMLNVSRVFLTAAALTVVASAAHAGGINLSWTDCGFNGLLQRNFACNSNSGANTMVASAISPVVMNQLNGHEGVMDMQTNEAALSNWWKIGGSGVAPNCRPSTVISSNFNFLSDLLCGDPWAGGAAGGVNYAQAYGGPNKARIRTVCAIPGSTAIDNVTEYYIFKVTFTNVRSTGLGSCAGCLDGACIALNSIKLTQPAGVGNYTISNPIDRNYVQWQGGGNIGGACPGATPTKSATWGSVKSLYR